MQDFPLLPFSISLQLHYVLGKVNLAYRHRSCHNSRLQAKSWGMMWASSLYFNRLHPSFWSWPLWDVWSWSTWDCTRSFGLWVCPCCPTVLCPLQGHNLLHNSVGKTQWQSILLAWRQQTTPLRGKRWCLPWETRWSTEQAVTLERNPGSEYAGHIPVSSIC